MYGKLSHDVSYFNDLHNYSENQKKIYESYFDCLKLMIEKYDSRSNHIRKIS